MPPSPNSTTPNLAPIKIDKLSVYPNLVLAPMSGVTNSAFRRLIKQENPAAVGLMVTEFISIEGLTRNNLQSVRMMNFREEERPLSIQIFGHDITRMVDAAKMVEAEGANIVDINSGCPVPKVVKRGGGCELMRQPEHLGKILSSIKKAVSIPVTLKIRSGWSSSARNALEVAKIAEDSGISLLSIHGRTREEGYRGYADWDIISEVANSIKVPVLGSGDIVNLASAKKALSSGVAGLMIGRAALSNPWIFSEIYRGLNTGSNTESVSSENQPDNQPKYFEPKPHQIALVMKTYLELLLEDLPPKAVIGKLKQLASQVTRRVRGSKETRMALCRAATITEFEEILSRWHDQLLAAPSEYFMEELTYSPQGQVSEDVVQNTTSA